MINVLVVVDTEKSRPPPFICCTLLCLHHRLIGNSKAFKISISVTTIYYYNDNPFIRFFREHPSPEEVANHFAGGNRRFANKGF
jgi:hypothetical protein